MREIKTSYREPTQEKKRTKKTIVCLVLYIFSMVTYAVLYFYPDVKSYKSVEQDENRTYFI